MYIYLLKLNLNNIIKNIIKKSKLYAMIIKFLFNKFSLK